MSLAYQSGSTGLWNPNSPPLIPSALDDEFNTGVLDPKWTEYDPGSVLTASVQEYGLQLDPMAGASYSVAGIWQPCPVGDWSIMTYVSILGEPANFFAAGLLLGQDLAGAPLTSDLVDLGLWRGLSNTYTPIVDTWSDYQTIATQHIAVTGDLLTVGLYLRLRRIGTTLYFDVSNDGIGWTQRFTMTQPFTPLNIGLYVASNNSMTSRAVFSFFRWTNDPALLTVMSGARN